MDKPTPYDINGVKGHKWTCTTNEEWREERSHSIGASSVGVLFGENHFRTPLELAHTMRDELNGIFNFEETEAMQDGHLLEDYVAKKFALKSGYRIIEASSAEYLLRRDDTPFMHASPDRTYWIDEDGPKHGKFAEKNKGILECKTTNRKIDPDDLPLSWIFQVQVQMGISGCHHAHIAWLCKRTFEFDYRKIEYDEEVFNAAIVICREFWDKCVQGGEDPAPVTGSDVVSIYPHQVEGKRVTATKDIMQTISDLKEMKATKTALEGEIDELTDKVKSYFTDEEALVDIDGHVLATFKATKGRSTLDSKKLAADYPDVYNACLKTGNGTRTLRIA